jgi:phosphatidylserine/phosphatidylglycerophosphate/cardiolipin synthase-like enzyme
MMRFSSLVQSVFRPLRSLQPALGLTTVALAAAFCFGSPTTTAAQERLCDTAFEDCRDPLITLIRNETVGIDVAFWFMEDYRYPIELKKAKDRGVRVRVLMDLKANPTYPTNVTRLNELQNGGIPMRRQANWEDKSPYDYIFHWKMMLFEGQNVVEFSAANYSGDAFVNGTPYSEYIAEVIYFADGKPSGRLESQSVINSFKTKFDDLWTNTTRFKDYANITGTPTRAYATYPIDPEMTFCPAPAGQKTFRTRSVAAYNAETDGIDATMYRITDQQHTNAIIAARNRGVAVRLITEQEQYRDRSRLWHSWNVDRLYVAGIAIRDRAHLGLIHQKSTVLHSQGMTIFGSSNWTSPSAGTSDSGTPPHPNSQDEHNYFTKRSDFYTFFRDQFERKWNNLTGIEETKPFVPLPPDTPVNKSPANGATGLANSVTLAWDPKEFGHIYDVYFGTTSNPPLIAANLALGPRESASQLTKFKFVVSELAPGTKYYWRVRSRTMASCVDAPGVTPCAAPRLSSVWSFTTAGGPPPPPPLPGPLLSDDFSSSSLDTTKWLAGNLFTGTQDSTIPLAVSGGTLVIGPLKNGATGSHYYGVRSRSSFTFSGVSAEVQLVEPPSSAATDTYAMFAVGKTDFYYRWYVAGNSLVAEKRASVKTTLATLAYSATSHQYLRIRHDAGTNRVLFETAPDSGGAPGTWTTRFSQTWDAAIPLTGVMIELKGGTSSPQTNPGQVRWDKVRVASN